MVTVSIDLGFYFSRVVAHYAVSPIELLQLPLAMFWMLSRNIDRLRAEEDVRRFQVARVAQADADSGKAFMEGLQHRIGRPVVTDKVYDPSYAKADPDAKEQLMKIFGAG
jgi:hypothetical protein